MENRKRETGKWGCGALLVAAKAKERNPQMSQMTQMGAALHKERKIMICGHLRHLRMITLAGAAFSISFAMVNNPSFPQSFGGNPSPPLWMPALRLRA